MPKKSVCYGDSLLVGYSLAGDLNGLAGDLNGDGLLGTADIDVLAVQVRSDEYLPRFDLNADGVIDHLDRREQFRVIAITLQAMASTAGVSQEFCDFLKNGFQIISIFAISRARFDRAVRGGPICSPTQNTLVEKLSLVSRFTQHGR